MGTSWPLWAVVGLVVFVFAWKRFLLFCQVIVNLLWRFTSPLRHRRINRKVRGYLLQVIEEEAKDPEGFRYRARAYITTSTQRALNGLLNTQMEGAGAWCAADLGSAGGHVSLLRVSATVLVLVVISPAPRNTVFCERTVITLPEMRLFAIKEDHTVVDPTAISTIGAGKGEAVGTFLGLTLVNEPGCSCINPACRICTILREFKPSGA